MVLHRERQHMLHHGMVKVNQSEGESIEAWSEGALGRASLRTKCYAIRSGISPPCRTR